MEVTGSSPVPPDAVSAVFCHVWILLHHPFLAAICVNLDEIDVTHQHLREFDVACVDAAVLSKGRRRFPGSLGVPPW